MDSLYFGGKLFYQDGWFVYNSGKNQTCVLTRDDARMLERAYADYQEYEASVTGMARMVEGVLPFREYGISKDFRYMHEYKVDSLAPDFLDVSFDSVLEIPEKVGEYTITEVLEKTFCGLNITKLILPPTVKKVGRGAFDMCKELSEIVFNGEVPDISGAFEHCPCIKYTDGFLRVGNVLVKAESTLSGDVIIPEGIEYIMAEAFASNSRITGISLPQSIRSIGRGAFRSCSNLAKISFPEFVNELTLGDGLFTYCDSLTDVVFPEGLTSLPSKAFCLCKNITNVKFPSSLQEICKWAFDRSKLEKEFEASSEYCFYVDNWLIEIKKVPIDKLMVKEGTVGIAEYAAGRPRCRGSEVGTIILPASVKYLNYGALSCTAEVSLDLNSVEYIEHLALEGVSIETVYIPKTCRYFGIENFSHNSHWKDVYFFNPDTVMDSSINSFGSKSPVNVHGYKGSTAQKLCEELGEKYNLTFVPLNKCKKYKQK